MTECNNCKGWGSTITTRDHPMAVPGPVCGRLTWPNLGVNLPAGCAVALAVTHAVERLRANTPQINPTDCETGRNRAESDPKQP